jgi:hypothetical protein
MAKVIVVASHRSPSISRYVADHRCDTQGDYGVGDGET